jgi:signal transduction histidine kinase
VRRRLVVVSLAVSMMVAIAFLVPLALLVRNVAHDRALTAATRDATALAPVLALTTTPSDIEPAIGRTRSGAAGRVTVYLANGTAVGSDHPADDDVDRARAEKVAFAHDDVGRIDLYQPVVLPDGTAVIEVSVPDGELRHGVVRSWAALAGVATLLVAGSVAVADRMARSIVRPTRRLATAAAELGSGNLDARVDPDGPAEIADVGTAFNHLAGRVRELLANERELVADLSHRLRTPLTALRLDAEALEDGEASTRVRADADRLEQTVTEIIEEARRPIRADLGARCMPLPLVTERAAFWSALAEDQDREWLVDLAEQAPDVGVAAADLEAAVDALLGNVFAHTPERSAAAVRLATDRSTVVITVDDSGPGLPADAGARGHSAAGSTGLGLDIARRTAESAGGRLVLATSPLGGARVELRLPALEHP